jgi:hypothetical protein
MIAKLQEQIKENFEDKEAEALYLQDLEDKLQEKD